MIVIIIADEPFSATPSIATAVRCRWKSSAYLSVNSFLPLSASHHGRRPREKRREKKYNDVKNAAEPSDCNGRYTGERRSDTVARVAVDGFFFLFLSFVQKATVIRGIFIKNPLKFRALVHLAEKPVTVIDWIRSFSNDAFNFDSNTPGLRDLHAFSFYYLWILLATINEIISSLTASSPHKL